MIKVENIEKSYGNERVLRGVSLNIEDGEFVSIMGESGSGKSTLLSIIAGFLLPDAGEVLWDGENIHNFSESKMSDLRCTSLGFVFQSYKLIPTLNIRDNILLPTILGRRVSKATYEYLDELTNGLSLTELLDKYPDQLSGGQCQRVAIVRALLYKPRVLIMDEPTGALDSEMEEKVMDLITEVNKKNKTTIIQVTHSQRVAQYATRIIHLKDGEICL